MTPSQIVTSLSGDPYGASDSSKRLKPLLGSKPLHGRSSTSTPEELATFLSVGGVSIVLVALD